MNLVVIGGSAGGIEALSLLLNILPANLPAALIVAIHRDPEKPTNVSEVLNRFSLMPVVIPNDGESLRPGFCYIGGAQSHVTVAHGMRIRIVPDGFYRSHNIDALFTSAARNAGSRAIGVVLSGLQKDGTEGLIAIQEAGGAALVQLPDEASYPQMPLNAIKNVVVDFIGSVKDLAREICRRVHVSCP
jgi:two-component system chemotaxis response regulator CheB